MMVTWSTFNDTKTSQVEFSSMQANLTFNTASGNSTKFVDGGTEKHTQYIHRVTLTGLKPGYLYGMYEFCFIYMNVFNFGIITQNRLILSVSPE